MIRSVAVVVPARDEQETIVACLLAIHAATPPTVDVTVCVVADRCRDNTAARARPLADVVVNLDDRPLGTVRDLGVERSLTTPAEQCWVLTTDADSTVHPDWIATHLALADRGVHAVAGGVHIADWPDQRLRSRYRDFAHPRRERVYGANLGVRGDVYRAVGGFAPLSTGEDQHLWDRVKLAGYRMRTTAEAPVTTSARTRGRAVGGLADLLAGLRAPRPA
ncbi:glycosyltransferase family 2 protein [Kutzneria sp. 744]|uniref:glycosyltransferase n=1 Tax=Kutzneria sp. (strain 744) TaxID=345341 RepID=UPI0003EED449|nr:glycosyltransferase [Kutzneria sp. 744]EWM10738.1 glycosyltransferase, group 2 [Kutzneria sp. 744]